MTRVLPYITKRRWNFVDLCGMTIAGNFLLTERWAVGVLVLAISAGLSAWLEAKAKARK